VHRSDAGSQYTSLAFTDALRDSVDSGGDANCSLELAPYTFQRSQRT
jgi:hypothetical protein